MSDTETETEPETLHATMADPEPAYPLPSLPRLAGAVAMVAMGAVAVGALAIGTLAIGRLAVGHARFRRLEVDELIIRKVTTLER